MPSGQAGSLNLYVASQQAALTRRDATRARVPPHLRDRIPYQPCSGRKTPRTV